MNTYKLFLLFATALYYCSCTSASETTTPPTSGSVLEVVQVLSNVENKFYELAKASAAGVTPGEVLIQTTDWTKTQPNVQGAYWFDSTYIYITLKSGLKTVFVLNRQDSSGLSITRGGAPTPTASSFNSTTAVNKIKNKKVLIYAPFVKTDISEIWDLYDANELPKLVNFINKSDKNVSVTLHQNEECRLKDIESLGDYGLVILNTHGLPDAFFIGESILYNPSIDSTEAAIKLQMDFTLGDGGYEKVSSGDLWFYKLSNISYVVDWKQLLARTGDNRFGILVTSNYLYKLPSMSNTIILGNMCYSGWNRAGEFTMPRRGKVVVNSPIMTAFTSRNPLSYYSYGYSDGTSEPVDNLFAKYMEDSLLRAFLYDDDSTGNAYLNAAGAEYTAKQLSANPESPNLPFKHWGKNDYSYEGCVTEFTDERDGQKYKAVCIGKQNWMAENLRYDAFGSECYDSLSENCTTYGRLYPWSSAMKGSASSNSNPSGVQGICPKGWHIPSIAEWEELFTTLGGKSKAANAMKLKSPLWKSFSGENNSSGFTGIPGGFFSWNSNIQIGSFRKFSLKSEVALFLSSTVIDGNVQGFSLQHQTQTIVPFNSSKNDLDPYQPPLNASCRCVKD